MTTTTDFIREMRELCGKATPGPYMLPLHEDTVVAKNCQSIAEFYGPNRGSNRLFFNAARTALPDALDRLELLEKVRVAAAWRSEIDALMDYVREEKLAGAFARMTTDQFNNAVDGLFLMHKNSNENLCKALREAEEG